MTAIIYKTKGLLSGEILRSVLISLISLAVDLTIFSLSYRLFDLGISVSVVAGFLCGALVNYVFSINYVFQKRKLNRNQEIEIIVFLLIGVLGIAISHGVIWIGMGFSTAWPEIFKILAAGITFVSNFLLRKLFLF